MARIKLGSIVTDLSGSAGGGTIQNSRHGHILRNKPTPCNPTSIKQLSIRSKIKTLQRAWINLSNVQRQEWNEFPEWANQTIKNSSEILLNGHDLFLKYQMFLLLYDRPLLTNLPRVPFPDYPVILRMYQWPGNFRFDLSFQISRFSLFPFFKITRYTNEPRSVNSLPYYFMILPWIDIQYGYIQAPYAETFGNIEADSKYVNTSIQFFCTHSPIWTKPVFQTFKVL